MMERKMLVALLLGVALGVAAAAGYLNLVARGKGNFFEVGKIEQVYNKTLKPELLAALDKKYARPKELLHDHPALKDGELEMDEAVVDERELREIAELMKEEKNTVIEKAAAIKFTVYSNRFVGNVKCVAIDRKNVKLGNSEIFSVEPPYDYGTIEEVNLAEVDKILCFRTEDSIEADN